MYTDYKKQNNPLVTVLMATYNPQERFLKLAIKSILEQSYKNFEFLIIDDGSTNNCLEIIESFDDPRIKIVHNEKNLNQSNSLNKGIKLALGKYIARMDDDDISYPDRLEKQVMFMEENKNIGLCGSATKTLGGTWTPPLDDATIRCHMFFKNSVAHPSVMIRKNILLNNNLLFNPDYQSSIDYELWLRFMKKTKLANLAEVLLYYRFSRAQIKTYFKNKKQKTDQGLRKKLLLELGLNPTEEELRIHNILCTSHYSFEKNFKEKSKNWLKKIKLANNEKKIYSQQIFEQLLDSQISLKKYIYLQIKKVAYMMTYFFLKFKK